MVTTGPYAYVRHPMYSGTLLFSVGTALLFGSWWGLLAVALFGVLIAVRAVLEEETLKAELEGYADYAAHVRYPAGPLALVIRTSGALRAKRGVPHQASRSSSFGPNFSC